jgi:F-type H+-transporting ATPase subunit b
MSLTAYPLGWERAILAYMSIPVVLEEEPMQLDWFTLVAQIVNFLILVLLLKHFLYSRIVQVMDDRERHITAQLEEAEQKQRQADQEADNYRKQQTELEESK